MKPTATLLALITSITLAHAEFRTWKDASGAHEIKAELVGVAGGKVTLKRENGTTLVMPLTSLSKEDQTFLNGGKAPAGTASAGKAAAGD